MTHQPRGATPGDAAWARRLAGSAASKRSTNMASPTRRDLRYVKTGSHGNCLTSADPTERSGSEPRFIHFVCTAANCAVDIVDGW